VFAEIALGDVQRDDERRRDKKRAEGEVPNPGNGPAEKDGAEGPNPSGKKAGALAEGAAAKGMNQDAGGGGNDALDAEKDDRRSC